MIRHRPWTYEGKGDIVVRYFGNDVVSHPRRLKSSIHPLWKPQTSPWYYEWRRNSNLNLSMKRHEFCSQPHVICCPFLAIFLFIICRCHFIHCPCSFFFLYVFLSLFLSFLPSLFLSFLTGSQKNSYKFCAVRQQSFVSTIKRYQFVGLKRDTVCLSRHSLWWTRFEPRNPQFHTAATCHAQ